MKIHQIEQSKETYEIIDRALKDRIPNLQQLRIDDNPDCVSQADLFGNIDTVLSIGGSEKLTVNQNKSRCPNEDTICFECRSFAGLAYNMTSGARTPVAGMYYYEHLRRYLAPRFGQIDCLTFYMPSQHTVFHFHRYFLEILFSKKEIWKKVHRFYITNDRTDTIVIYINIKDFIQEYIRTFVSVTCGGFYNITLQEPEENKQIPEEIK